MRYIDADKFAERIKLSPAFKNTGFDGDLLQRVVLDVLDNAPTADVVEVVRCKDCECFIPDDELDHNEYPNHIEADGICYNFSKYTDITDFCSCGERKDGKDINVPTK